MGQNIPRMSDGCENDPLRLKGFLIACFVVNFFCLQIEQPRAATTYETFYCKLGREHNHCLTPDH